MTIILMIYPLLNSLYKSLETQNSMLTYKEALKQKRESEEEAEKDQRLGIIEEKLRN